MRAIAASCLVLGLLLSGCGGSPTSEPGSRHKHSGSPDAAAGPGTGPAGGPSASTTAASGTAGAVPAPPRATNDDRGRTAFAQYVLQAWIYALDNNDPKPLLEVSGRKPCDGCSALARELRKRDEQGWHVGLDGVRVSGTRVSTTGDTTTAAIRVAIPESASYNADGSFRATNPAHPDSTFTVRMTRAGGKFRLDSFSLY